MKRRYMLNLQQKLVEISIKLPKLLKKHYSDEVDYDFVKIDDIFEILNPAFAKYHICIQELEELDAQYKETDSRWIYTSKLIFYLVNADQPEEREKITLQLVGDHQESPAKAKGAAWTYGFKYFLLYKFQIIQETDDPDMKGEPPKDRKTDKTKVSAKDIQSATQKDTEKKTDVIARSPLSMPPKKEKETKNCEESSSESKKETSLPDPSVFLQEETQKESDVKEKEREIENKDNGKNNDDKMVEDSEEAKADMEENVGEKEVKTEPEKKDEPERKAEPGGKTESAMKVEPAIKTEPKEKTKNETKDKKVEKHAGKKEEGFQQMNLLELNRSKDVEEADLQKEKKNSSKEIQSKPEVDTAGNEQKEQVEEKSVEKAENSGGFYKADKEEIPFEDANEDDFFKQLEQDMQEEAAQAPLTYEEAEKLICPYALFEGKTFGEMMKMESGRKQLEWFAEEYRGSDLKMKEAAKILLETDKKKAA